jgi:glucan-binding YG repeat protein
VIFTVILITPITSKAEWRQEGNDWYYYDGDVMQKGWFTDDNNNDYYFNTDGKMATGLIEVDGDKYYLSEIEDLIGIKQTGWMKIENDWYYFSPDTGAAKKTSWLNWTSGEYYFASNGKMAKGLTNITQNGLTGLYYFLETPYPAENDNVVVHIQTQADLNNYLSNTGKNILGDRVYFENNTALEFPENGIYYLNYDNSSIESNKTYWYITSSSTGNIDFNGSTFLIGENNTLFLNSTGDHSNQEISNATFYGTVDNAIRTDGTVSSKNGNFNADLIHASNMTFSNLTFNNCQDVGDHVFDVMGSDHITFDGITINGYFGNVSVSDIDNAYSLSGWTDHYIYAEAIQIDASNDNSSGISNLDSNPIFDNSMADGLASTYITITNSSFGPYNGASGQTIIDKTNVATVKSFGATIGSHAPDQKGDSKYSHLTITNNTFTNTICRTNAGNYKNLYPIHYEFGGLTYNSTEQNITLSTSSVNHNTFVNLCSEANYDNYGAVGDTVAGIAGFGEDDTVNTDENANSIVDNATSIKENIERDIYSNGVNLTGWQTIDGNIYYFRTRLHDGIQGYKGMALINVCADLDDGNNYCFDENGILMSTTPIVVEVPTTDMCSNPVYNGQEQAITKPAPAGYTWGNNTCNFCNFVVTATLNEGYIWSDGTTTPKEIRCSTQKAIVDKPVLTKGEFVFNGQAQYPEFSGYDSNIMGMVGSTGATSVGEYEITITPHSGAEWTDGTTTAEVYVWNIIKYDSIPPVVTDYTGVYDGNPHTFSTSHSWDNPRPEIQYYVELEYSDDQTNWSDEKPTRTEVGTTTVYVRAKATENYNASSAVEAHITITKASVAKPVLEQSDYPMTGQTINPVFSGFDDNKMQIISGITGATNIGEYELTIEPKYNYQWTDGTTTAEVYVWRVVRFDPVPPVVESYSGVYDGQPHTFTVSHPYDDPREHIQYFVEMEYSYDQSTWFDEKPTRTEVGTTTVYVRAKQSDSFNASEAVTATITITSTSIDAPTTAMCSNAVYNGEEQSITLTNQVGYTWSNNLKTNAGEYTVTATLSNGFSWSDGSSTNEKYITCSIAKAKVAEPVLTQSNYVFNGSTQYPVFTGFDENKMVMLGTAGATAVGEYPLTIQPLNNYEWTNGGSEAVSYTWSIIKADAVAPTVTDYTGTYDGEAHTIEVTYPYDGYTFEYSLDNVTFEDEKPTRTEVGITTVYVRTKENEAHNASPSASGTITINSDDSTISGWYDDGTNKYYYVNGLPVTGLFTDTDGRIYYFNEDNDLGNMLVGQRAVNNQVYYFAEADDNANDIKQGEAILGWKEIDGNTYYFRTSENVPNNGPKGSGTTGFVNIDSETYYFRESNQNPAGGPDATMVEGLAIINDNKYYFRTTADEVSTGSEGSMLKDACVTVDNGYYCFDENGTLESQVITVTKPTTDRCISGIVYDGTMKELISNPVGDEGYTWSNYGQTNAGEHVVTATLNEDYKWNDDSTDPVEITCSISKKQLEKPVMNVSSFNYSGYQITPIIDSFNNFIMNINGDESATDVGEYSSTVSLKFPTNYEWNDGTQTNIAFVWTINKVDYSAPTVTPYFNKYDGDEHTVQATGDGTLEYSEDNILWSDEAPLYTNAGVYPVYVRVKADDNHNASQVVESSVTINKIVVNYPTLATTLYNYTGEVITPELTGVDTDLMTVSAETSGTNAGEYSIFVSLNDRVNTVWEDDSDSSYTITWRIAKISGDTPTVMPYSNVYDKQPHSIEALGGELEYSLDDTNWSDEKPTRTDVGTTTVYVRTKGDDNHNPSASVNSTITITKRSLIKPTMTTSNYLFTGSEINFSINFYNDNWSDWMEKAGTYTATTVGSYVAEVALLDTNNTEWNDHTITNVSFNWSIVQSQSNVPVITNYVGTYDGEPHSITVAPTSYGTLFYSTNYNIPGVDAVWSTVNPTRTNVGTTNVYVYIRGDANHTDSPVVMGSITIIDVTPDYEIDNYEVDESNKYIGKIKVGTTLEEFISNITLSDELSVSIDTVTVNGEKLLYTGGKTRIMQGNVVIAEFINIVTGDPNGDGEVDSADLLRIRQHLLGTNPLVGAFLIAGDIEKDNSVDSADLLRVRQHLLGTRVIE